MAKFEAGKIVYHKAMPKKGVISSKAAIGAGGEWLIVWEDGKKSAHREVELYTEEEFKEEGRKKSPREGGSFMSA